MAAQCLAALRRHLESDCWPADLVEPLELQLEPSISKPLNLVKGYATHFGKGRPLREQLQNFIDQCKTVGGTRCNVTHITTANAHTCSAELRAAMASYDVSFTAVTADLGGRFRALGFMAQYMEATKKTTVLVNYGSQLHRGMMSMGASTKRNDAHLAGHFGEGVKVEINCLLRRDCSVQYRTSNMLWEFNYYLQQGEREETLQLVSHRQPQSVSFSEVTIVSSDEALVRIERSHYLFLEPGYQAWSYPCASQENISGLELLRSTKHRGCLYVHGIFVDRQPDTLKGCGLNYLGSGASLSQLGLGRDRDSLKVTWLVAQCLPELAQHLKGNSHMDHEEFLAWLYQTLQEHPESDIKNLKYSYRAESLEMLADLWMLFQREHPNTLPVAKEEKELVYESGYLGIRTLQVSKLLFELWSKAKVLPSQESLWHSRAADVHNMPDAEAGLSPEDQHMLQLLRSELAAVFHPHVVPQAILFRAFPPGNQRLVIALPQHLVIDINLLSSDSIHSILLEDQRGCMGTSANGSCACRKGLLLERIQAALAARPGSPSAKALQWAVQQWYMGKADPALQSLTPSMAPPRPASAPAGSSPPKQAAAGSSPPHAQPAAQVQQDSGTARVKVRVEDVEPAAPSAQHSIHHSSMRDAIRQVLSSPGHAAGAPFVRSGNGPGVAGAETVILSVCKSRSADELHCSTLPLLDLRGSHSGRHIYMPAAASEASVPLAQVQSLFRLLLKLHEAFTDGPASFHVYYDPSDGVIAFNAADKLWYNSAYDCSLDDLAGRAEYWFHTICHELAHHFQKPHNSAFASYVGKLTLMYSQRFCTLQAELLHMRALWQL